MCVCVCVCVCDYLVCELPTLCVNYLPCVCVVCILCICVCVRCVYMCVCAVCTCVYALCMCVCVQDERISAVTQLYSVDEDITQCISAHAVCFSLYQFAENPQPSTVFCVSSRETQDHGKVSRAHTFSTWCHPLVR